VTVVSNCTETHIENVEEAEKTSRLRTDFRKKISLIFKE
jgi:hypothetical protein